MAENRKAIAAPDGEHDRKKTAQTSDSSNGDPPTALFFKLLPPEIRNQIYSLAYDNDNSPDCLTLLNRKKHYTKSASQMSKRNPATRLLVSKKFYNETFKIFVHMHRFRVTDTLNPGFLRTVIKTDVLSQIAHLSIDLNTWDLDGDFSSLQRCLPGLRSIHLHHAYHLTGHIMLWSLNVGVPERICAEICTMRGLKDFRMFYKTPWDTSFPHPAEAEVWFVLMRLSSDQFYALFSNAEERIRRIVTQAGDSAST